MFERYTERARRVLFFGRAEAMNAGAREIAPEHLLLGILKDGKGLTSRLFARRQVPLEEVRNRILARVTLKEPLAAEFHTPFSTATVRALDEAAGAADRGGRQAIGVEDLLIGVSRGGDPVAAATLAEAGLTPDAVEEDVTRLLGEAAATAEHLTVSVSVETAMADPYAELARLRHEIAALRERVERLERRLPADDEG